MEYLTLSLLKPFDSVIDLKHGSRGDSHSALMKGWLLSSIRIYGFLPVESCSGYYFLGTVESYRDRA